MVGSIGLLRVSLSSSAVEASGASICHMKAIAKKQFRSYYLNEGSSGASNHPFACEY
jgi:hypothetical protein